MSSLNKQSSSTRPTAIDLPLEMIRELFKYLHPKDLAACSLVNKCWHSVYAAFKVQTLATINARHRFPNKWRYTDHQIEEKAECCSELFGRLIDQPLVSNLRYLALFVFWDPFDLNKLNRFDQLVRLEINNPRSFGRKPLSLNLPRLEFLAIFDLDNRFPLSVDCPQLSVLLYGGEPENVNLLEVKHPETIRKLETNMFGPKLTRFKNVECLISGQWKVLDRSTLVSLSKLNELHFHLKEYGSWSFLEAKGRLQVFLNDVYLFRASGFKFRFAGLQLTREKLEEVNFNVQIQDNVGTANRNFKFYLANYRLIEPDEEVKFTNYVNYTILMIGVHAEMAAKFPSCFWQKFSGVERVFGSSVGTWPETNASHFLWFLKSLSSLRSLQLYSCSELTQEFYDHLPASAQRLEELEIRTFDELHFKFDFLSKLPRLTCLKIEFAKLSLESMSSIVSSVGRPVDVDLHLSFNGDGHCLIDKKRNKMVWQHDVRRNGKSVEEAKDQNPEVFLKFYKRFKVEEKAAERYNFRKRKREGRREMKK